MRVRVESSARLHLGFYNLWSIRAYGSIGVMINEPRVVVEAEEWEGVEVINKTRIPVEGDVERVLDKLGVDNVRITVHEAIPRHVGLGSTTQLMLSTAAAVLRLKGESFNKWEIAALLGRGRVSGIGVAGFGQGGFIADSGRGIEGEALKPVEAPMDVPRPILRYNLPRQWVFAVLTPSTRRGLDEEEEWKYLSEPMGDTGSINCRLHEAFLEKMIPGIVTGDPYMFAEGLGEIQEAVGEYFSRVQGGIFMGWEPDTMAQILKKHGALAVGQSSWGPTVYGFYKDEGEAHKGLGEAIREAEHLGISLELALVSRARRASSP